MSDRDIAITCLDRIESMKAVVDLQRRIWGYGEPGADHPFPERALLAISRSGGLVALATDELRPVGFSLAWLGRENSSGRLYLQSQTVGILESHRHAGLGFRLKLHQRDFALGVGLEQIRWTFDPLQSANARLNLHKLGATVSRYCPDYFGRMRSAFNAGIASDRVWAEWDVESERVERHLAGALPDWGGVVVANRVSRDARGCLRPEAADLALEATRLGVSIPDNFDLLRREKPELARAWRLHVREVLDHYLNADYVLTDLQIQQGPHGRDVRYILGKQP